MDRGFFPEAKTGDSTEQSRSSEIQSRWGTDIRGRLPPCSFWLQPFFSQGGKQYGGNHIGCRAWISAVAIGPQKLIELTVLLLRQSRCRPVAGKNILGHFADLVVNGNSALPQDQRITHRGQKVQGCPRDLLLLQAADALGIVQQLSALPQNLLKSIVVLKSNGVSISRQLHAGS